MLQYYLFYYYKMSSGVQKEISFSFRHLSLQTVIEEESYEAFEKRRV